MSAAPIKVYLNDDEMPRQWYNLGADLPTLPPLGSDGRPISPEQLAPVFPMNLIEQEVSRERWIPIPDEVQDHYRRWRSTPLQRAVRLEKALGTPARIYFKNESVSPAGSHKPNTALAQAYYNREAGVRRLVTETGAGQWGSALAFACAQLGLECKVYMVRVSHDQKPHRRVMMETWGASCVASPSDRTRFGRAILEKDPDSPGSLGIAISEAVEEVLEDPTGRTRYALGSVLNHVMLHQTIIGLEAKRQLEKIGETRVDQVIGCVGGGSNFAGISFPFICDKIAGRSIDIIPVEPASCPTLTRAPFAYDHGDTAGLTPLLPMYTLGRTFIPPAIHAGGLRYHGMAPLVSAAAHHGLVRPRAVEQLECYQAALLFARCEGLIVAPETSHAVAAVVQEARLAKEEGKEKVILFSLSGHGLLDLNGYASYLSGQLRNHSLSESDLQKSLTCLQGLPVPQTHPAAN
jgi:tryptophan synthase beta chain